MMHTMAKVRQVADIAQGIFLLRLYAPEMVAAGVAPGQFVHIRVPGATQHLLRRPISIMATWPTDGELDLAIQMIGEGTRALRGVAEGDSLSIIGALGRGFDPGAARRVFFVGGGVGVAPIRFAMDTFAPGREGSLAFFGFRSGAHAYATGEGACPIQIATDDGSLGAHGLVPDLVQAALEEERPDLILACGPTPMLRTIQRLAVRQNVPCQLSLEEYMGCGIGACLVCNCKVRIKDGTAYKRVCIDGPVFDAKEVCFDV